jgi:hypothetical protein
MPSNCALVLDNGRPCRGPALHNDRYCRHHTPAACAPPAPIAVACMLRLQTGRPVPCPSSPSRRAPTSLTDSRGFGGSDKCRVSFRFPAKPRSPPVLEPLKTALLPGIRRLRPPNPIAT